MMLTVVSTGLGGRLVFGWGGRHFYGQDGDINPEGDDMVVGAIYRMVRNNGSICGSVQTDGCKCWVMPDDGAPADLLALRGQVYSTPQAVLDAVNAIAGCSAGPFCTTV